MTFLDVAMGPAELAAENSTGIIVAALAIVIIAAIVIIVRVKKKDKE